MKQIESRRIINDYRRIKIELNAAASIEEYIGIIDNLISNNWMFLKPKQKLSRKDIEVLIQENELIEFEDFETFQQVTTLFKQHGVGLMRKFRELLSDLFKDDSKSFTDHVETLWELDMKFSDLMRMYSDNPDSFFAPSWNIYILLEKEKKDKLFAIPIDYIKLNSNEEEEISNTRKAIRSFCEYSKEMIQITAAMLNLNKHRFSKYKLPENMGGRFVYELSQSLTIGKKPYLLITPRDKIAFRNQLAEFFGVDQKKVNTAVKEAPRRQIPNRVLQTLSNLLNGV